MENLESEFERLSQQWKKDTLMLSNVTTICKHPDYQRIMAMGQPAVPLMLKDLKQHPGAHWYCALVTITGLNPVTQDIAGQMRKMADAWLKLGREKGWLMDGESAVNKVKS